MNAESDEDLFEAAIRYALRKGKLNARSDVDKSKSRLTAETFVIVAVDGKLIDRIPLKNLRREVELASAQSRNANRSNDALSAPRKPGLFSRLLSRLNPPAGENQVSLEIGGSDVDEESLYGRAVRALESDPAWSDGDLIWTATLDSETRPICLGLDGQQYKRGKPGPYWDGHKKIDPIWNCRCYMMPKQWRDRGGERIVVGDRGEKSLPLSVTGGEWILKNPRTARTIFGEDIGDRLLGRPTSGKPVQKIDFASAVSEWIDMFGARDGDTKSLAHLSTHVRLYEEAMNHYAKRDEKENLDAALAILEEIYSRCESSFRHYSKMISGRPAGWAENCYQYIPEMQTEGFLVKAFQQLAIIYDKQGRHSDAIAVCENVAQAGWSGDWAKRISRYQKKLAKKPR
ncbi:phage head morphogenesis protein [Synechococcus sp. CCY 0621]|uniref:phage head morphogenesis protein n=1 Tax=Synechococcus sp. CCY 0621 TaxID=2815603 RepID=UPI001C2262E0|nr:phage head morphogenesis protein [Synechococcus sp. CCY 0621]